MSSSKRVHCRNFNRPSYVQELTFSCYRSGNVESKDSRSNGAVGVPPTPPPTACSGSAGRPAFRFQQIEEANVRSLKLRVLCLYFLKQSSRMKQVNFSGPSFMAGR